LGSFESDKVMATSQKALRVERRAPIYKRSTGFAQASHLSSESVKLNELPHRTGRIPTARLPFTHATTGDGLMPHPYAFRTLAAGLILAAALTGCSGSPAAADPNATDPNASDPNAGLTSPVAPGGTVGIPTAGAATGYGTTPATGATGVQLADMTAVVASKTGGILHTFSCVVQVTNPNSVARTGKVTVTFVHAGTPETGSPPQTQSVSVAANGTQSLTFKDNKYHLLSEDATVDITSDPVQGGAVAPAYGAPGAVSPTGY
jgi:hypothetical protein